MATLLIREPTQRRHVFRTERPQLTIGRSLDNELALHHGSVSRIHAGLYANDGTWTIEDLQSRNGTFVNGRRIQRHALRSTDTVRIGDYEIMYFGENDTNVGGFDNVASWAGPTKPLEDEDTKTGCFLVAPVRRETTVGERLGSVIRRTGQRGKVWRPGKTRTFFGGPKGITVERMLDLGPAAELQWNRRCHTLVRLSWYADIRVNDVRLTEPVVLEPDDAIRIGRTRFVYELFETVDDTPPAGYRLGFGLSGP
jgi:hypothetical protein